MKEFIAKVNEYGRNKVPFLFLVDFEMEHPKVWKIDEIDPGEMLFDVNGQSNAPSSVNGRNRPRLKKYPLSFEQYNEKFNTVHRSVMYGDSYLTNLTVKTKIELDCDLRHLFSISQAKYKLWWKDRFLVFSPETFVQISQGEIRAFPMKGTIDASIEGAEQKILDDPKELAEHVTIVDLIRNDLSLVSEKVRVKRFRYVEKLTTSHKSLLQVSSEVMGELASNGTIELGQIIYSLLPAGSVSGAPKRKTLEIIRDAEEERRGYYTGVFGWFDGETLDSGVLIRFIEQTPEGLYYRSGGGITSLSNAFSEYEEVIDKIYVPLD